MEGPEAVFLNISKKIKKSAGVPISFQQNTHTRKLGTGLYQGEIPGRNSSLT